MIELKIISTGLQGKTFSTWQTHRYNIAGLTLLCCYFHSKHFTPPVQTFESRIPHYTSIELKHRHILCVTKGEKKILLRHLFPQKLSIYGTDFAWILLLTMQSWRLQVKGQSLFFLLVNFFFIYITCFIYHNHFNRKCLPCVAL